LTGTGDNFDRILGVIYVSWLGVLALCPPFFLFIFHSNFGISELPYGILTWIFRDYTKFLSIPFILIVSFFGIESGIWGVYTFILNQIYMTGMSKWMEGMDCDPTEERKKRRESQLLYRSGQLLHLHAYDVLGLWFSMTYYICLTIIIVFSFCLVRYVRIMDPMVLCFMVVMASNLTVSTGTLFESLIKIQLRSSMYLESFQRNCINTSAEERLWLKSAFPIQWKVGAMFTVSETNFCLKLYGDIVINSIVSLVVSFR